MPLNIKRRALAALRWSKAKLSWRNYLAGQRYATRNLRAQANVVRRPVRNKLKRIRL